MQVDALVCREQQRSLSIILTKLLRAQNLQQAHTSAALAAMMQGSGGGGGGDGDGHNPFEAFLGQPFMGGGAPPMPDLTSLTASIDGAYSLPLPQARVSVVPRPDQAVTHTFRPCIQTSVCAAWHVPSKRLRRGGFQTPGSLSWFPILEKQSHIVVHLFLSRPALI